MPYLNSSLRCPDGIIPPDHHGPNHRLDALRFQRQPHKDAHKLLQGHNNNNNNNNNNISNNKNDTSNKSSGSQIRLDSTDRERESRQQLPVLTRERWSWC